MEIQTVFSSLAGLDYRRKLIFPLMKMTTNPSTSAHALLSDDIIKYNPFPSSAMKSLVEQENNS